ncbi:leucine-rich repeat domain-containing protein [Bifidobacterium ramosum]|nr:S-layer homology domain-containing protein [Bifidobacterium ramosum]
MYRTEQLASVDVSHNPELKILAIPDAKLTSLDVSKNPKLQDLDVSANRMTSLDVSHNPELSSLYVGSAYTYDNSIVGQNRITSLDVSHNPKLGYLDVSSNRLTSLDVSNNPGLIRLDVSGNKLSRLDVSRNTKLTYFNAANTAIPSMDLSRHTGLVQADGARSGACEAEVGVIMDGSPLVALRLPAKYSGMVYTYDGCADVDAQNAVIKPAVYEGGYYGSTFDLSSVASWFDGTKVSDLKGAKLEGTKLTGLSGTADVTYTYDTSAAKAPLKAHLKLTRLGDVQLSFADVNAKTPHADDITWLASSGISTGWKEADGSATFRGMSSVKRQDMAAFLYRLAGSPAFDETKVKNPFRDVTSKTPHYKEIMWLYSTGISTGWRMAGGSYEFRGMNSVVRQDMAAFLHRLADYEKAKPSLGQGVSFRDVTSSTPHSADITWLAKTGVTTGWAEKDGSTTFRGMSTVKRQDMAAFLHRMKLNVLK